MPVTVVAGSVASVHRYPVKSMQGEELDAIAVDERGLAGDRAYALIDTVSGRVASAKHPRKWGKLLDCRAAFVEPPQASRAPPAVRITLPDGSSCSSDRADLSDIIERHFGRRATLTPIAPATPTYEIVWPQDDEQAPAGEPLPGVDGETVTAMPLAFMAPPGAFVDVAPIHLITSATIARLSELAPAGSIDRRKFRPNLFVDTQAGESGFVENGWIGRTLAIGDDLRLQVTVPCPRCVMSTPPQAELAAEPRILTSLAQHNKVQVGDFGMMACAGVYATVLNPGVVRRGDIVRLL